MDRLLLQLLGSKAVQGIGISAGAVLLIIYLVPMPIQYKQYVIGVFAVGLLFVWFYFAFLKGVGKGKAKSFEKGLANDAAAGGKGGSVSARKAQGEVAQRWQSALTEIRKSGMDLYALPWYLLIGEPQSGKSTTLKNSGLEFPVGTEALSGAGGTRNCDWWFTNEAIVLDTAGRFTFQEKDAPDAGEWKTFLGLLKKKRARCPINGVLLVIPCSSLLGDGDEERERKAINIREKLTQIQRDLEVQFPVFVLITKADQILGFTEFFSRLPAADQRQMLGWSMHGPFIQAYDPGKFNDYFDSVSSRVHKLRLKLLGEDLGLSEIDKFYLFPEEFKSLREPLGDYLKTIFVRTHYLPPLFFRGFYFTSGLQEGKPIAKACAAMIRNAGPGAEEIIDELAKAFTRSKAFFIRDFYVEKLFPERNMVIHSVKKMGWTNRLALLATIASVLLIFATGGFMYWRVKSLNQRIGKLGTSIESVKKGFIEYANVTRDAISKGQAPSPPREGLAAEALAAAETYSTSIDTEEVHSLGLDKELAEIHWMYVLQNVVFAQGCYLYDQMKNATAGEKAGSSVREPALSNYAAYARLWSANDKWLRQTRSKTGTFSLGADAQWDLFLPADKTGQIINDKKASDLFRRHLDIAAKALANEGLKVDVKNFPLDKDGVTDEGDYKKLKAPPADPPIELWLVPGALAPRANEPIKNEIEKASDVPPMSDEMIQEIAAKAKAARERVDQLKDGALFNGKYCTLDPAADNPFSDAIGLAASIQTALGELQATVEKYRPQLDAAGSLGDKDQIKKRFDDLKWVGAAFGEPRGLLDRYIDEKVNDLSRKMGASGEERLGSLRKDENLRYFLSPESLEANAKTVKLRDDLSKLVEAISIYKSYVEAQSAFVKSVAGGKLPGISKVDKPSVVEDIYKNQWQASKPWKDASAWLAGPPVKLDIPKPDTGTVEGKMQALGQFLRDTVGFGDEAVLVEAYLQYFKSKTVEGGVVGDRDIQNASLEPPGKDKPYNKDVYNATAELLQKMIDEFEGYKKGIKCAKSLERMETAIGRLSDRKKAMRGMFEKYWATAYDRWSPGKWIDGYSKGQWKNFWADPLFQKGEIVTRSQKELEPFVTHVGGIGGSKDFPKIEKDIVSFMDSGSRSAAACSDFGKAVVGLGDDEIKASLELDKHSKDIDGVTGSLGGKFDGYPRKVRELLGDKCGPMEAELKRVLAEWQKKLGGKFPFAYEKPQGIQLALGETTVNIPQASEKDFLEFFLGDAGLGAFLKDPNWGPAYEACGKEAHNKGIRKFVDQCLALRDYFVDGKDMRTFGVKVEYTGFKKGDTPLQGDDLRKISEDLVFIVPSPVKKDTLDKIRSRETRKSEKQISTQWRPGSFAGAETFHFESKYALNDPDDNTAGMKVPGAFSVLAYLDLMGASKDRRAWQGVQFNVAPKFRVKPEQKEVDKKETYTVTFNISIDAPATPMPALPDWGDIREFLR